MTSLTSIGKHFTEDELLKVPPEKVTRGSKVNSAPAELFYPKQKRKEKLIMSEKNEPVESWPNLINGYLQPLVYGLNKGREIKANSPEHKKLKELLEKANNFRKD